jgi:hypothetical protein
MIPAAPNPCNPLSTMLITKNITNCDESRKFNKQNDNVATIYMTNDIIIVFFFFLGG